MRLKRLELKAFGPFTERTLEFAAKEPGLHIIFGPNEAGKSSSLRALKALLYGFPQQTPDNFIHSYDQLLVGGCLENDAGEEIVFRRRKKRIGDLIDEAGNPLEPGRLAPFLHGVEPEIFESLYGIDHQSLIRGGEEILAQKGEVGQALFAAGAGISSLHEVIAHLEKEAIGLFKATGQLPAINTSIKHFKELQRKAKAANLSVKEWKEHRKTLKNAEAERSFLEKERDRASKELRRLERLHQAIPELASFQTWRAHLRALGKVTLLPPDFSERCQQVIQAIHEARRQLQNGSERLVKLQENRRNISLNKDLLREAERVDDFHQRLGEYRKGQKDRPERNGMRIGLRKEAALLLQRVRPDLPLEEVEILRPILAKKRTIHALSAQYEAKQQQLASCRKQAKVAQQELQDAAENLADMPVTRDARGLFQAVKLAHKAGDIDGQLEKDGIAVRQAQNGCILELRRIGLWAGDLDGLRALSLPLAETIRLFEQDYREVAEERRRLEQDRTSAEKELKATLAEIKKMEYAGEIPSEEELTQVRAKRDSGWQLLRRQWLEHADVSEESQAYAPGQSLPAAYEGYVGQADLVADRLRREADRVVNAAALHAQVETLQEALADNGRRKNKLSLREQDLQKAWSRLWKPVGIAPLSPKEMNGWRGEIERLLYKADDLFKKEQAIQGMLSRQQELRQALLKELESLGEQDMPSGDLLGPILAYAETVLERIGNHHAHLEKVKERQKNARQAFAQAQEDLNRAEESFADWQLHWRTALSGLGLQEEISTLEATDCMEALQGCFDKIKEADDLKKRIEGIDRDAAQLEKGVRSLLQKVAPDLLELSLDQAILKLRNALAQAQEDSSLYNKLTADLDSLREEVAADNANLDNANEQLGELLRIAGCEKPEELPAVMSRFAAYQRLQEKVANIEATLAKIGAGVEIEDLARQAAEVSADELPGRIESLRKDITERIHPEITRLSEVIGKENEKLAAMNGGADAAEAAEKAEQELARIRRLTERYAQVKLASKILQVEIERYRKEHQDPVLQIASGYFKHLTLGSFDGLRTDLGDKGEPILVGIRAGGAWVGVEGMSDGTRDQLYLSLRLATLEWRLQATESIPFIVDDILINFDDERSKATLEALADLSEKNQVILFTHHRQVVDEASKLNGNRSVHICQL